MRKIPKGGFVDHTQEKREYREKTHAALLRILSIGLEVDGSMSDGCIGAGGYFTMKLPKNQHLLAKEN